MIVIADTSPINYLVLIQEEELLSDLFGQVIIPEAVWQELHCAAAPQSVQRWLEAPPSWIQVTKSVAAPDESLSHLDEGEREAIQIAEELRADLLLVDEKTARREAKKRNLATSGTLGILDSAADKGLVDFFQVLQRLKQTSFFIAPIVEQFFLERDKRRKSVAGGL